MGGGGGLDQLPWQNIDEWRIIMADSDMIERLEKQIEGSNLALAAVAEVLQKMDSRLTKAEDEEFEFSQEQEDEMEKQEIIKAVAGEVYGLIKADTSQWANETTVKAKSMPAGHDDAEKAVTIDSKTENANRTIQAMQKQLELLKESLDDDDDDREDDEEDNGNPFADKGGYGMAKAGAEEEEEEYPEDEEDEDDISNMQKQIAGLRKMVASKKNNVQKMIQSETEQRLRKMGFREENGLNKPQLIQYSDSLGVDGASPIRKSSSSPEDTVDQMMQMSYGELRRLQEQVDSGETEGVPRELLGY